ncbi:putative small oligopeptide opt family [Diaporthe ampelina]|uniref:Putative small oligopeptide opt family n=1 Tax=Diaporthe ampelina TaxID=1214573 RepID=A0A0G2FY85_9PEZI|nr:putative small oligopeptide opt family [Diaporthe ampelina]
MGFSFRGKTLRSSPSSSGDVLTRSTQVPRTDDVDTPVNTVRAWSIGILLCTIITAVKILIGLRKSPAVITASVVQLIAYPIGRGWTAVMPNKEYSLYDRKFNLISCPFNK